MRTTAEAYIEDLQAHGQYHFTTEEAQHALGSTITATRAALRRLKGKTRIADPYRGFHVIVPPEYRSLGCVPPDQFLPDLMAHVGEPYYVALLSAAGWYGAAHQRPHVFQVIVPKARRPIECGGVAVQFLARHDMQDTPVSQRNTPRGVLRISTPEATAFELVGYMRHCGGIDNVATVLTELSESMKGQQLLREVGRSPLAWVQRLGYLLSLVEAMDLANLLESALPARSVFPVPLVPHKSVTGVPRDERWRVFLNADVEPDL
ncbi:MAG: type IV toxin-antitoxin system AbiEi family antitoxin [Spirochaetaceae bacterium]|nr:type IV toxin-antitoxin system AbiEi family antitoxin [Spirochaetaceae bacterium]